MRIEREQTSGGGRYVAKVEGSSAELTFRTEGDTLVIDFVGVPTSLEGQGVGSALVAHAVEEARARGEKLLPRCSFAKAKIARRPDWQDVLADGA